MNFSIKYSIDKIGISNTKYILNHIENYLVDKEFIITQKTETHLKYQNKYLYWGTTFSLSSFVKAGKIKISKENDILEIKLIYTEYWSTIFLIIWGIILYIVAPPKEFLSIIVIMLPFMFVLIFVFRFFAQRIIFNRIKEIMIILSA